MLFSFSTLATQENLQSQLECLTEYLSSFHFQHELWIIVSPSLTGLHGLQLSQSLRESLGQFECHSSLQLATGQSVALKVDCAESLLLIDHQLRMLW